MKAINVGIVKAVITRNMSKDFLSEGKINESKEKASKFLNVITKSPLLQLEHKVFNRLENKEISNDMAATRYIDNNLSLFEGFTQDQLINERNKLKTFIDESIALIDDEKYDFYVALGNLISETLDKKNPDVDLIHESFTVVLNHVKKEKEIIEEQETAIEIPKEFDGEKLIEVALTKFSEKYNSLTEQDMKLIKKIVLSDDLGKKNLFESLRDENIHLLKNTKNDGLEDKIVETVNRIEKMEFKNENAMKDIMSLHELKTNLI